MDAMQMVRMSHVSCLMSCVCVHACGCVCDGGLRGGNRWGLRADVRSALLCGCGCVALLWGIIMRLALLALCGRHLGLRGRTFLWWRLW